MIVRWALCLSVALAATSANATNPTRVLTYSSMLGEGSLGEQLEAAHVKAGHKVVFSSTDDNAGLLGRLRSLKKRKLKSIDVVFGMAEAEYRQALAEGLVEEGRAFDESAFAIMVDTQQLKPSDWPKSWSELGTKLKGKLIIEDPRTSSVGVGWLLAVYAHKLISPEGAKAVVKRSFPSWSSAYEAFLKGEAPAVWSFRSSEAYHRCNEKDSAKAARYRALPLAEGYPVQREFVARVKGLSGAALAPAQAFEALVVSAEVQKEIPRRNWMFPANEGIALESCFRDVTAIKPIAAPAELRLMQWLDEWSLHN